MPGTMAANDRETDDVPTLGGRHPLAARANGLDGLTDGEREWIAESVDRTDGEREWIAESVDRTD
jgi:hypothetical protein